MSQPEIKVLPEHIRANLAKCSQHVQMVCLECGYDGLIGVQRQERKYKWLWFLPFVLVSVYGSIIAVYAWMNPYVLYNGSIGGLAKQIPSLWVFVVCGGIAGVFGIDVKKFYLCPNCECVLKKNDQTGEA